MFIDTRLKIKKKGGKKERANKGLREMAFDLGSTIQRHMVLGNKRCLKTIDNVCTRQ
jgi:hypothetical protein